MAIERAFACISNMAVIARALAFLRSLENTGALADAACYVLCLDEQTADVVKKHTTSPNIHPLTLNDLPEVQPFAKRRISQFAFACKPFLLRKVLTDLGASRAIYMDADTWMVGDPAFLFDELTHHSVLLVPAITNPAVTLENWDFAARSAQRTGYYNGGFVGCNQDSLAFLDWWADRCAYSTGSDFYEDIFADQKYLNWASSLFDGVKVMRHRGLNVKNFSARQAVFERQADGRVTLSGDPLIYFHFSQNLGNLTQFPPELYPEVSRYLAEVERARADAGQPYVDMSRRDNSDLNRPLLPRTGRIARLIALNEQVGQKKAALQQRVAGGWRGVGDGASNTNWTVGNWKVTRQWLIMSRSQPQSSPLQWCSWG